MALTGREYYKNGIYVVTANAVYKYRETLRQICEKAAEEVQQYLLDHRFLIDEGFLNYAEAISTKYGEAAGALSCEFYDSLVDYWTDIVEHGADVPGFALTWREKQAKKREKQERKRTKKRSAEPAPVATREEVRGAVLGAKEQSLADIAGAVERIVKLAAEDTTLMNAGRDGYEFAWIPEGDTCAFCIMLASNGWQRVSEKTLNNGHATHVHANCDCTYVIRPVSDMYVDGYDPDKYYGMYYRADGDSPKDKVNSMRRDIYAENKDRINAQKRSAYKKRKERESSSAEELNAD